MTTNRLHRWEAALMAALALFLMTGVSAGAQEAALADRVVRLHVIANSDSDRDQALKLAVRDAVLARAQPLLEGVSGRDEAEQALSAHLDALAEAARETLARAGCGDSVAVTLEDVWFPTRVYADAFALPAGQYRALRVVIGAGQGRNWWCVVFPPLCLASVTEESAAAAGFSEAQAALITGRDGEYVLKFKLVEWWSELMKKLGAA